MATPTSNAMSGNAASRARELLAAKELDSLLQIRDHRSPTSINALDRSKVEKRHVRVATIEESSSRVQQILASMKEKREDLSFASNGKYTKVMMPSGTSDRQADGPGGKPPLRAAPSRDTFQLKMSESLKEKRQRIARIARTGDVSDQRVLSMSPYTVETATTEDSHSTGGLSLPDSWTDESSTRPASLVVEVTDPPPSLQDIEEAFENEESSIEECTDGDESEKGATKTPDSTMVNQSPADLFESIDSIKDESPCPHTPATNTNFDKRVSFDEALLVIEEMKPPSVVHCMSFDSAMSRDRSLSGYAFDDFDIPLGAAASLFQSLNRKRTSSWDASDLDENESRRMTGLSLLEDHDRRLTLLKTLEMTYSELTKLHKDIEHKETRNIRRYCNRSDEESDSSFNMFDDEDSQEFTNDSNTSGWISQDESNSKLHSLIEYMTSEDEDDDSYTHSHESSYLFSRSSSNLETLLESHELEEEAELSILADTTLTQIDEESEVTREVKPSPTIGCKKEEEEDASIREEAIEAESETVCAGPKQQDPNVVGEFTEEIKIAEAALAKSSTTDQQDHVLVEPVKEEGGTSKTTEEADPAPRKKRTKRENSKRLLFVPRMISNKCCRATGGLRDLAIRTGISDSRSFCVKSIHIPQPPDIAVMNAAVNCGTQGSHYNIALRSGCQIEKEEEPRRLRMPPLPDGKRRWLLKSRGGHYHLAVWTTVSKAALLARIGYAIQEAPSQSEQQAMLKEEMGAEFDARGIWHDAKRSEDPATRLA